jgi:hypothetical protein
MNVIHAGAADQHPAAGTDAGWSPLMMRSVRRLQTCGVVATDGEIGDVHDLYFDDERWTIRYLAIDATRLEEERAVIVSPMSVEDIDWQDCTVRLTITCEQVNHSPGIDAHEPVSRQHEAELSAIPFSRAGVAPAVPGPIPPPGDAVEYSRDRALIEAGAAAETVDSHLHSTWTVIGYRLEAIDGEIGHIDDFLVDESWAIRYAVVHTSNWWFGNKVLIAPEWMTEVRWSDSRVAVDMTRQAVRQGPPYDPRHLDRQWEMDHYAHHRRRGYWE